MCAKMYHIRQEQHDETDDFRQQHSCRSKMMKKFQHLFDVKQKYFRIYKQDYTATSTKVAYSAVKSKWPEKQKHKKISSDMLTTKTSKIGLQIRLETAVLRGSSRLCVDGTTLLTFDVFVGQSSRHGLHLVVSSYKCDGISINLNMNRIKWLTEIYLLTVLLFNVVVKLYFKLEKVSSNFSVFWNPNCV